MAQAFGSISDMVSTLASILTLGFSIAIFIAYRKREHNKIIFEISQRLYEADKVIIEHPEIQEILKEYLDQPDPAGAIIAKYRKTGYYRVKSYVYMWLNVIDEMVSTVANEGEEFRRILDYPRWERYFVVLMKHPFFKELCKTEGFIFGKGLEDWLIANKTALERPFAAGERDLF